MREIHPGPLVPFCEMEKHTGSHRHDRHIKHIPKERGGEMGGLKRGRRQEQLFLGLPPKPTAWDHRLFSFPASSVCPVSQRSFAKIILVSITWWFSAEPARLHCLHHTFQIQTKGIFTHQSYREVSGWSLWREYCKTIAMKDFAGKNVPPDRFELNNAGQLGAGGWIQTSTLIPSLCQVPAEPSQANTQPRHRWMPGFSLPYLLPDILPDLI